MQIQYCKSIKIIDYKESRKAKTHVGSYIADKAIYLCPLNKVFAFNKFLQKLKVLKMLSFHINQDVRWELLILKQN